MEEVIERLKLCMSMSLNGGEQTIVNIADLENLLKRYKELEEENKLLTEKADTYYELYWEKCIPISVIQNKIDELYKKQDEEDNKLSDLGFDLGTRNYLTLTEHKIDILQELLEERRTNEI